MKKLSLIYLMLMSFNTYAADTSSDITLNNSSGSSVSLSGIYIQSFASSAACNNIVYGNFPSAKKAYGVMWKTQTIAAGSSQNISANLLYQMISQMNFTYSMNSAGGANCTPGVGQCEVGDAPNTNQWCIKLGLTKGSVVGVGETIADGDDLLPLIDSQQIIVTCSDLSSTCVANTPATQAF